MKKMLRIAAVLAVFAALVAGGYEGYRRYGRRERPLVLAGTIEARDVDVGSLVGGRVLNVHVDEGATVAAGQPIVTLDPALLDLQVREQRDRVGEARAALARVRRGPRPEAIARARIEWESAERERQRQERLLAEGLVGRQAYDLAVARAQTAREAHHELQRGSTREDVAVASAAVGREESRLAYLHRQRDETIVRAPVAGTIQALDLRPGDLVAAGQPVARLLEPDQIWLRAYVPEPQLGLVHVGDAVDVRVDTFPDRRFGGRIVEIRDRGEYTPRNVQTLQQRYDQVFGVKIVLDPSRELKAGMAATVTLRGAPQAVR